MQLHFATLRDLNTEMYKKLGPDTGFDSIAAGNCGKGLAAFLAHLHELGILRKPAAKSSRAQPGGSTIRNRA